MDQNLNTFWLTRPPYAGELPLSNGGTLGAVSHRDPPQKLKKLSLVTERENLLTVFRSVSCQRERERERERARARRVYLTLLINVTDGE